MLLVGSFPAETVRADGVKDAEARMDAALQKIEDFDEYASILNEDLHEAEAQLVEAQVAVEDAKVRIAALEAELTTLQGEIGELALKTFMTGDEASGTGSLLTGAGTITEVVEREEYARLAMSEGQSSTDEMASVLSDLEDERANLEFAQKRTEDLIESVSQSKEAAEAAAEKAQDAYAKAKADYGDALVEREQARQRRLLAEAAAAQAAAAARIGNNGGNTGGNTGGGDTGGGTVGGSTGSGDSGSSGNSGAGSNVPPPSPGASGAVAAAKSQVGVSYQYATANPGESFDCSGLTAWAWEQAGISLPHQSRAQYASTTHVSPSEAQPGDLIFFYNPISHVGIYIGGGMMVDAANERSGVRTAAVNWGKVVGVGRPG